MTTDYPKNLNYKPEGTRNIGRPQTRWRDDFAGGWNRPRGLSLIVDDEMKKIYNTVLISNFRFGKLLYVSQ